MKTVLTSCSRLCTALVAVICMMGVSAPVSAQVNCDTADLQDLIDYIASLDGTGCGLDIADNAMDISVNDPNFDPCDPAFTPGVSTYFENGFDQTRTLIAFDNGNLYLGMRVVGIIGDADGNGDPDNNVCADDVNISDEPGIGLSESYRWFLDTNCDGIFDITVTVNNNGVQVAGTGFSTTNFEYSGSDLKVCVTGVDIDPFFQARGFSGHLFDGLGEDLTAIVRCGDPTPLIDVEKTVDDVCPGLDTTVNVTITNTGDVELDPVEIQDTLPAGFTYVGGSSTIGEPGIAGPVLSWTEGPLAPGGQIVFSFMITAPEECEGNTNNIDVSGTFSHPCVNDGIPLIALDSDSYDFDCTPVSVDVVVEDAVACVPFDAEVPISITNTSLFVEDIELTCIVGGVPQAPQNFADVGPGQTVNTSVFVTCDEAGPVTVSCTAVASKDGEPECQAEDTDSGTATCSDADVRIALEDGESACVPDQAVVTVTVYNDASDAANLTVDCIVGGVGQAPVNFNNVEGGGSRQFDIPVTCSDAGPVTVSCVVTGTSVNNPECTDSADDGTTVMCREACVAILPGENLETCVGSEIDMPFEFENCSSEAANMTVTLSIDGVPQSPIVFNDVSAGDTRIAVATVACVAVGDVPVSASVELALVSDPDCVDDASQQRTVTCGEACVDIVSLGNVDACVGDEPSASFTVENCSAELANITVTCTIDGVPQAPTVFNNVAAGDTRDVNVPVTCSETGPVVVVCDAEIALVSNPECVGEDSATATVTCAEACIAIVVEDATVCVGEEAVAMVTLRSCTEADQNYTLNCIVDGVAQDPLQGVIVQNQPIEIPVVFFCEEGDTATVECTVNVSLVSNPDCTDSASDSGTLICLEPGVDIEKTASPEVTQSGSTITLVVANTGNSVLDNIIVSDHIPAGLNVDALSVNTDCGTDIDNVQVTASATLVTFTPFSLGVGESCTITYDLECAEFDNVARVDTAIVVAWCEGLDPVEYETYAVTDTSYATVTCQGGEACPRTIGFWRQQCAQKLNGSTKVCLEGMYGLWRCVIEETGVNQWKLNGGGYESTAELSALSDANLFARLCSQLQGPRPMTIRDMTEVQYLGLMLNVCSGALPSGTLLEGPGGFEGTVAEAIANIENALNTGEDLDYWKTVADDINNRVGVIAADCPEGVDFFRNIEPCGDGGAGLLETQAIGAQVSLRAFPNPVLNGGTVIQYNVPASQADRSAELSVFDVSGRLVRKLVEGPQGAGIHSVNWDLRDGSGQGVPSGIYFYRLRVGSEEKTQRLMVLQN